VSGTIEFNGDGDYI